MHFPSRCWPCRLTTFEADATTDVAEDASAQVADTATVSSCLDQFVYRPWKVWWKISWLVNSFQHFAGHNVTILSFQWCRIFFYHQHSCLERRPQVRVHWRSYICCGEGKLATFRLQVKGVGGCRPRAQRCFACCWACSGSILLLQAGVWLGSWLSQPLWHACAAVCIMSWTCGWLA